MGIIPRCKTGICHCPECNGKETEGRKVGKVFSCMNSYRKAKAAQYTAKANQNSKVRLLGKKQVQDGNYFMAERQALSNDLDYLTRRIVKLMAVNERGWGNCYICGADVHIDKAQAMHFIKRSETALRWDFRRNLRFGCKNCNEILDGNMAEYERILNEEQKGLPDQLREEAREVAHISREELKQMLSDYRARLRILEAKFKPQV